MKAALAFVLALLFAAACGSDSSPASEPAASVRVGSREVTEGTMVDGALVDGELGTEVRLLLYVDLEPEASDDELFVRADVLVPVVRRLVDLTDEDYDVFGRAALPALQLATLTQLEQPIAVTLDDPEQQSEVARAGLAALYALSSGQDPRGLRLSGTLHLARMNRDGAEGTLTLTAVDDAFPPPEGSPYGADGGLTVRIPFSL